MWSVATGDHLSVLDNTVSNISIRPCVIFDDNVKVASAQMEGKVTVSVCVCVSKRENVCVPRQQYYSRPNNA